MAFHHVGIDPPGPVSYPNLTTVSGWVFWRSVMRRTTWILRGLLRWPRIGAVIKRLISMLGARI